MTLPRKGSPFQGISGTKAPARNTKIPNLTAHVAEAKARKAALTHGGLLTSAQQKAASDAGKALAAHKAVKRQLASPPKAPATKIPNKPPTKPAKSAPIQLGAPPAAPLAQAPQRTQAPASSTPSPTGGLGAQRVNPRQQMVDAQPKQGSFLGGIPSRITGAAASEVNTGLHDPLASIVPGGALAGQALHAVGINVTQQAAKQGNKAASKIKGAGEKTGSIPKSFLSTSQAAQFPGQKTVTEQQIAELEAEKGGLGGLSNATRHTLIEGSVANGWPREMAIKAVDSDLIHLYGNKPANPVLQFAKNLGSFAATQAAGPAGVVALGDAAVQAAKGNTAPLKNQAQQFVQGSMVGLPVIGAHPFLHDLYWHPGESAQNLSLVAGLADRAAGAASKFAPGVERSITPEGFASPISRGQLATRPLQRGIEKTRDAYVRSDNPVLNASLTDKRGVAHPVLGPLSPVARRTALAKEAYQATRERAVAPTMARSNQLRANVMRAATKIGKERAAALNAHLQGVDPVERAAFYRQVSSDLGTAKGRGALAHAKLSEKHPVTEATMTPEDHAYVSAVRSAAEFATSTRAGAGQLSADLSGRYRAYQAPIVVAAKNGDELAQRTQTLHNEWTDALAKKRTPEELQPIATQFKQALDEFTQQHTDAGGTTPVYIPQEVPQTLKNQFRREASVTTTSKVAKLKATQDKLFSSGQYRSTPSGVSLETHRAAVVQARIDHFKAVNDEYTTKAENGAPADPNVVYVKAENLRSPVKLENTVGEHNLTDENVHSTLDQMRQALEGGTIDVTSGYIPAHGDIRAIPKTIYDELHASTLLPKGSPIGMKYDVANRAYQRFMLSKPSTAAANIVGNPILATFGGASPLDIAKGYDIIRNHPDTLPPQLMGEGLAGAAGERIARTPIGKFINFSISHQRASEDAARAALYHHLVGPHVRQMMEATGKSADQVLKDLAEGRDPKAAHFVKKVEDFLGSMKPSKKFAPETEKMLSRGLLFHRWLGHILTLTLYTMPVKYPGRAVLLQRISEIGDDYRKHHGVFPSWYSSMIPLLQHIATGSGTAESFTRVLPTGSIWPTANLPLPLADSEGANPWSAVINSTQPVLRSAVESPTGMDWASMTPFKDAKGAQFGPGLNLPLLLGQEYRNLPYAGVVTPFPGKSADAYPGHWTNAVHKNRYGSPLPAGFGTSAIPYGGSTPSLTPSYFGGALSRLFLGGSGLQDLPAQTRGTNYARTAQMVKARQGRNKIIREQAKQRAARHR